MKGLQKILQFCGLILGVVAFILMLACNSMTYEFLGLTTSYSGTLGIFGDEYIKATWTAIIAFILFIVALLAILCALVLPLVNKKSKGSKMLAFIAAIAIIVAGVLLFFEVGAFTSANDISSTKGFALGIGWVFSAILGIVSGCLMLCSNLVKGK